jgi:hypothetical protein
MMSVIVIKWPDLEKAEKFDQEFGLEKYLKGDPFKEITCHQYAKGVE